MCSARRMFAPISSISGMSAVLHVAPSRPIMAGSAPDSRTLDRDRPLFSQKRVRAPRKQRLPTVLSHAEVRAILAAVRNPIHRTCFELMYACGLRIGEAAKVEISDIENTKGVLRIIGKGDKERRVPLPEPMLAKLRRLWLTHRNPRWLTPDRSGTGPISKNALWRTFRLAVRAADIKRPVNPHGLRHSYVHGCSSRAPRCARTTRHAATDSRPRTGGRRQPA